MGILDNFERGLERAVNGAFAKTFRSGIQPVEIASALRRELDTHAAVVSRDRILAPNRFDVSLSPRDAERMAAIGPTLDDELVDLVEAHAKKQGFSFAGPVEITLHAEEGRSDGTLSLRSQTAEGSVSWRGVVEIDGRRYPLTHARTVIGRGSDADITLADPGTSRRHVEILWDGERAMARDLGSTNGSTYQGQRFREVGLSSGSTIRIGRTDITFSVVPVARHERGVPG